MKWLIYTISILSCVCPLYTKITYTAVTDGQVINLSLSNYNVSDPAGQSVESFYQFSGNSSVEIAVVDIPGDAVFFLLQAHSFNETISLSYLSKPTYSTSVNGSNVGLWVADVKPTIYLHYNGGKGDIPFMLALQAYSHKVPIPGGCNMEFPTETAPYLDVEFTGATFNVKFAAGSPPVSVFSWLGITENHSCLKNSLTHKMYRSYLPERTSDIDLYFTALKGMMTVGRIAANGNEVPHMSGAPMLARIFAAYPDTASTYVVVVSDGLNAAVYVPAYSYACNGQECSPLGTPMARVFCAILLFMGLFTCFTAHRFYLAEMMIFGFLLSAMVTYCISSSYLHHQDDILLASAIGGALVGCTLVVYCCCFSLPLPSILLATTVLGYMLSAILVMPLVDYINLTSDINYWMIYFSVMLLCPVLLIHLSERANVLSSSFIGAYVSIVPIDFYVGSNLRYIFLNSLRRIIVPNFKWAVIDAPFQLNDIFLTIFWGVLAVSGYYCQSLLIKGRPPFPPPSYARLRRFYRRIRGPVTPPPVVTVPTERTHLLVHAPVVTIYSTMPDSH